MKRLIKQAIHLIRQNPFYSLITIIGTAVTIAFVMVVVMIYEFRTANIAPESHRSRVMYTDTGVNMKKDGSNVYSGMGRTAYEALFVDLPGVDEVTWYAALKKTVCSLPASSERYNYRTKNVAANWFSFFDHEFIAGRPFTQSEYDLGRSAFQESEDEFRTTEMVDNLNYRSVVISEKVARQLFGSAEEAIGKHFLIDFSSSVVVGVFKDVSAIFQTAYAEIFQPYTLSNEEGDYRYRQTNGLHGNRLAIIKLSAKTKPEDIRQEIGRREELLNEQQTVYQFKMENLYTHEEYTFFRNHTLNVRLAYVLLVLVILGVPAIGISGLMNAQIQGRLSEIAIRKAYGASNFSIIRHFFAEGLVNTLLGGILGFLLSCMLSWLGRIWLFGSGNADFSAIFVDSKLLFRTDLFIIVLSVCLVFNLLSVLFPIGMAVRRNIIETLKGE